MRLKDICKINSGKSIKACLIADKDVEHSTPCFGGNGLRGFVSSPNQVGGNPIIGRVGAQCGNVHYCKEPFYATEHALVVTIEDSNVNPLWLCRKLESMELGSYAEGAAQPVIAASKLLQLEITVPSLSEQQAIVSRLDSAFAKIDAVKANAEKQLNDAKALFQKELSKAMMPKEGWERKKFGEVCTFVRGPFGGSLKKNCFKKSGYAVYEQQNAIYNRFTFRYFIDEKKYREMERFSIQSGDLIMSCSGTIGKVAIIPDEAAKGIINQALLKLSPKKNINRWYLKYLMESSFFKKMIQANSDGAAIKNISSVAVLKNLLLKIPPLSEQQAIVTHLDTLSEKLKTVEEKQKAIMVECDAMKQALLREVFE